MGKKIIDLTHTMNEEMTVYPGSTKLVIEKVSTIEKDDYYENYISGSEFVLFFTGWGKKWNTDAYFESFPVLTEEATMWLSDFKLKAVGFDCFSIDSLTSTDMKLHKIMLSKDICIIENLNDLDKLPSELFEFYCIPLKIEKADGSPIRAFGMI
ncbi:MAG: cyclase family protein [Candidatus Delongbacteria bacterium]|nr:cyclase family protein [Candidatus Delongbacteria bacterium]